MAERASTFGDGTASGFSSRRALLGTPAALCGHALGEAVLSMRLQQRGVAACQVALRQPLHLVPLEVLHSGARAAQNSFRVAKTCSIFRRCSRCHPTVTAPYMNDLIYEDMT